MSDNNRAVNERAWDQLARAGCRYTTPVTAENIASSTDLLSPLPAWLDLATVHTVLCLGGGGGQQGPVLASLGKQVVVLDISKEQLARDKAAAAELGLQIETIHADMADLSMLRGRAFDLVLQPVSSTYVPNFGNVYRQLADVIPSGGMYFAQHWNPVYLQMPEEGEWDGSAYRLVFPQDSRRPLQQSKWNISGNMVDVPAHVFAHPINTLLGDLCDAGFVILRIREKVEGGDPDAPPGSPEHLQFFVPSSFFVLARRL